MQSFSGVTDRQNLEVVCTYEDTTAQVSSDSDKTVISNVLWRQYYCAI